MYCGVTGSSTWCIPWFWVFLYHDHQMQKKNCKNSQGVRSCDTLSCGRCNYTVSVTWTGVLHPDLHGIGNLNLSQCWPWPSQVMSVWKKNLKKFLRSPELWPPVLWGGVSMYLKTEQGCYTESPMMPNLNLSAYSERPPKVTMNKKKNLKKILRKLWPPVLWEV